MFVHTTDPTEMAERFAHDPTDKILSALDGEEPLDEGDERNPCTMADVERYLDRLPPFEADIVVMYTMGKRQADIASILGITQAGISYRYKRAMKRIEIMRSLPDVTETDLRRDLAGVIAPIDVEILVSMSKTSCQTRTAEALNYTQGRIRHRYLNAVELLEKRPELSRYAKFFRIIFANLNIFHEVELSHWMAKRQPLSIV